MGPPVWERLGLLLGGACGGRADPRGAPSPTSALSCSSFRLGNKTASVALVSLSLLSSFARHLLGCGSAQTQVKSEPLFCCPDSPLANRGEVKGVPNGALSVSTEQRVWGSHTGSVAGQSPSLEGPGLSVSGGGSEARWPSFPGNQRPAEEGESCKPRAAGRCRQAPLPSAPAVPAASVSEAPVWDPPSGASPSTQLEVQSSVALATVPARQPRGRGAVLDGGEESVLLIRKVQKVPAWACPPSPPPALLCED